ncbi:MAG: CcmD family protein [Clostridia bacterium]|nr:MAG: CcmD family protein [Clostridia bacterium]
MEYVWAAYSVTWIFIFAYTLVLGRRQARLLRELAALREAIGKESAG